MQSSASLALEKFDSVSLAAIKALTSLTDYESFTEENAVFFQAFQQAGENLTGEYHVLDLGKFVALKNAKFRCTGPAPAVKSAPIVCHAVETITGESREGLRRPDRLCLFLSDDGSSSGTPAQSEAPSAEGLLVVA